MATLLIISQLKLTEAQTLCGFCGSFGSFSRWLDAPLSLSLGGIPLCVACGRFQFSQILIYLMPKAAQSWRPQNPESLEN